VNQEKLILSSRHRESVCSSVGLSSGVGQLSGVNVAEWPPSAEVPLSLSPFAASSSQSPFFSLPLPQHKQDCTNKSAVVLTFPDPSRSLTLPCCRLWGLVTWGQRGPSRVSVAGRGGSRSGVRNWGTPGWLLVTLSAFPWSLSMLSHLYPGLPGALWSGRWPHAGVAADRAQEWRDFLFLWPCEGWDC